ncbi:MAG: ribosome-associated translation inhibitor RaiA [Anaerolineales bacterium]|nr:ribosome-associated translation inhibitor RaiA [Anaerolineales bacterium]
MTVQIEINVKNMDLSDQLREYVEKKVAKLDRYLDTIDQAQVDLTHAKTARNAKDRQVAQLTIRGKGVVLRAEERTEDMFASVDLVLDKIYRQIERYKGRHWRSRGDGRSAADLASFEPLGTEEEETSSETIARRKRHLLSPMDEREAIEQMLLLGHEDFFIFLNTVDSQVNILYRRRDGTLGLIETENK